MQIEVVSAPAYEPISVAEAADWCRLASDDVAANTLSLSAIIKACRIYAENLTRRSFIERTLRATLLNWPADATFGAKIALPYPPLVSVSSIVYVDTDGVEQTLGTSNYVVHTAYTPGIIVPAWDVSWPTVRGVPNAIRVTYVAGYAAGSPSDEGGAQQSVPDNLRLWMRQRVTTIFDNRAHMVTGTIVAPLPRDFVDGLLDELRVGSELF